MNKVFLFTQNLKLNSFDKFKNMVCDNDNIILLTTHYLFENERNYFKNLFKNVEFKCFADYITDEEMSECDESAYKLENKDYLEYLRWIKKLKNKKILENLKKEFPKIKGYILSEDLGIDGKVWKNKGFKSIRGEYYYENSVHLLKRVKRYLGEYRIFRDIYYKLLSKPQELKADEVYVAQKDGKKYIFIGKMHRIAYRLNIEFKKSEDELEKYNAGKFYPKEECQYLTTLHEMYRCGCNIPESEEYDIRFLQDGYLPPNHSEYGYNFVKSNVKYYAWDTLGEQLFHNKKLPVSIIPFRKKLYLPLPNFKKQIKTVLIVASGSGDWTAVKSRSDDDLLVEAFAKTAKRFPNIKFVYRCHPTWVHPLNVGVNSINRVAEYFSSLNLPNLVLSSSIPPEDLNNFQLSFSRSLLDEDLKNADLVFGEHSISMIDAAFKNIPFCSVNMTKRRNFFCGITNMGFPHATSLDEISNVIENIINEDYQIRYLKAIEKYNEMTDMDD